jgi:dihydroorotase/N-acyl-D-amino-acid deacylase
MKPHVPKAFCSVSLGLVLFAVCLLRAQDHSGFDIVITNGHIIDGTGSPWYSGDLGIRDGKVTAIGNLSASPRKRTIDTAGKVVAPGFIDMLGQSEYTILVDPRLPSKIFQGITTEITGEGNSIAPLNDAIIQSDRSDYEHYHITPDWRNFRQYFARLEKQGMGINLASYVGATQVRRMVLGDDNRQPTPQQLDQMKSLVGDAMKDGTVGVSAALEYAPAPFAKTEELIALAAEGGKFGGIYSTHMRNESDSVLDAIDEALRIGREAHVPVEIWHLKVAGKNNWGRMPEVVAKINAARASGTDVTADTYAYTAWFNDFSAFIPPWAHDGGTAKLVERLKDPATREHIRKDMLTPSRDWDNEWQEIPGPEAVMIGVVQNPKLLPLQGMRLSEIAKLWGKDPIDTLFDFLIKDPSAASPFSACRNRMSRSRCSSLGFPSITILPELPLKASWDRSTLTPVPMELSRESFASMFAKRESLLLKTLSARCLHCPHNACALPIAAFSKLVCGPISSSSTPLPSVISPPSTTPINSPKEWNMCW